MCIGSVPFLAASLSKRDADTVFRSRRRWILFLIEMEALNVGGLALWTLAFAADTSLQNVARVLVFVMSFGLSILSGVSILFFER